MPRLLLRPLMLLLLLALAGGGVWAWQRGGTPEVETIRLRRGPAVEAVYATGTVEAEVWARIPPVVSGRIAEVLAHEGERVRAGQPLARLDDRQAHAKVAELEAKAAYLREEAERSAILVARGVRAREALDKDRSEFDQVTATIRAARQQRSDLLVTSPIDGVVLRRDGEPGELAETKDALFWVGALKPLRITAEVDEEDIPRVKVGQKILIKADAFPGKVLEARVDRITPKGDPVNKTFRVRALLPEDSPLLIGMTTEINIVVAEHPEAWLMPASAVVEDKVLAVEDGVVVAKPVRLGIRGRSQVEVLDGIGPDLPFLAAPPPGLKPGTRVRVK